MGLGLGLGLGLAPFGDSCAGVQSAAARCPSSTMQALPRLVIFAALAGLVACGKADDSRDADARSARHDPAEGPRYADADRDGRVTREEASVDPALAASFDRYDGDGNGQLDRAEFARLEAGAAGSRGAKEDDERHTLRPRREFPRPLD